MKNILILDTGKEWGGGTNSLLELLRRIDKKKYNFTVLFYYNYRKSDEKFVSLQNIISNENNAPPSPFNKENPPIPPLLKGGEGGFLDESDIKTEIEKLNIDFILFKSTKQPIYTKILKEIGRAVIFFNRRLRKLYIFWIDYLFRTRKNADGITKLLKELNIDLLYMNNQPSTNLEGIIAAKNVGIKSLLHSRIEAELNSFEVNAVNKWLTKMICVSDGVKESFVRQGINSLLCTVVHNGIDINITPVIPPHKIRQEFGIKEDEIVIGSVGSLVRRKRFDDLIKAVAYIRGQGSGVRGQEVEHKANKIKCIIIGDGPEKESLQREIDKNKLDNIVILTGFKSEAISYINAMDIFILPSEREGFPRVILEAMLMGKPVIASRIAGPAELVINGETGFLIPVGRHEMFAAAILKLIENPELRQQMGQRGRQRVIENFSIEKYVSEVSLILAGVAG